MRIALLHASAGHGHSRAAEAIREGFSVLGVPEQEILLLDALDETPVWFKKLYTSLYYLSVKYTPQAWGGAYALLDKPWFYRSIGRFVRQRVNSLIGRQLIRRIQEENPDVILSTHFLAPEILGRAKKRGEIHSILITVVTDFIPHLFWVNPGTDFYWVMSEEGKKILEKNEIPSQNILPSGIPISPRFHPQEKKGEIRLQEGLDEGKFTLLITSGSFGLGPTPEVLSALRKFGNELQVMVVCGRNQALLHSLEKESYPFKLRTYGFISHMDQLMEASDLLVAKPGGATTAESLAKGVPMVVLQPIPGQEAGNAGLLKERNASFFIKNPSDIELILRNILDRRAVLKEKKESMSRLAKPDAAVELARFALRKAMKGKPS